jgi:uncharacterized SAM-binding protein YcdF (DUF218 family)
MLVVAVLSAGAWFARAPVLRSVARLWIVSDAVTPADAVAVFGGGLDTRPFAAAEYYHKGLAKKILLADSRLSPSEKLEVVSRHAELNRQVLLKLGVPNQNIETVGTAVSNTREEALALREWADRTGARRIIVPTELFSSRRVRWMLERAFEGTHVQVEVVTVGSIEYTPADWWQHEEGLIAFQNELIKYVYYRIKY